METEDLRRWTIHIRYLSDVSVSRNWYKTVSNLYENLICIINAWDSQVLSFTPFYFSFTVPLIIRMSFYLTHFSKLTSIFRIRSFVIASKTCKNFDGQFVCRTWHKLLICLVAEFFSLLVFSTNSDFLITISLLLNVISNYELFKTK